MKKNRRIFIICTGFILSFVLGCFGFSLYFKTMGVNKSILDILYITIQLYVLESGALEGVLNPYLNIARFLAPATASYAILIGLSIVFRDQTHIIRAHFMKNHVFICGLSEKGNILAGTFLKSKKKVVVIEKDAENDYISSIRKEGAVVVIGDAAQTHTLKNLNVDKAQKLYALCGDDSINTEIAVILKELFSNKENSAFTCFVNIENLSLARILIEREIEEKQSGSIRVEFFNRHDIGAKLWIDKYEPFETPCQEVHIAMFGLDSLGESLIIHLSNHWNYAKNTMFNRFKLTLIDENADQKSETILSRYPFLKENMINIKNMKKFSIEEEYVKNLSPSPTAIYVTFSDASCSFYTAFTLSKILNQEKISCKIITNIEYNKGLSRFLEEGRDPKGSLENITIFGPLEDIYKPEEILDKGINEILARAIHQVWLREQKRDKKTISDNPNIVPWAQLDESIKESNREQAEDIPRKLGLVGYSLCPIVDWNAIISQFEEDEIETMAKEEHLRWCESKKRDGWKYGDVLNTDKNNHPALCSWEDLDPKYIKYTRQTIQEIPEFLRHIGFQVIKGG